MRAILTLTALIAALMAPALASAQAPGNPFAPVIQVNDSGITGYEIDQRMRFLALLRTPGDLREVAEKALIEDRLRMQAARREGIRPSPDEVLTGMTEFAARAELSLDEFLAELAAGGVEPQSFRDFAEAGLAWREVVRRRFLGRVSISEAEVDRAISPLAARGLGTRVLISEIVIPAAPGQEAQAEMIAAEVSQLHGEGAFAEAARQVSAAGSRSQGGRLDWLVLDTLPGPVRDAVLPLAPGEASSPVSLQNAVAVFMLRGIDEDGAVSAVPQTVEYAQFLIAGGRSAAALAEAERLRARVDRCNDLFAVAKGLPESRLRRETREPGQLPPALARELARLDPGESSTALTEGDDLVFLMLCSRERISPETKQPADRDATRSALQSARVSAYADGYLADLQAEAIIRRP